MDLDLRAVGIEGRVGVVGRSGLVSGGEHFHFAGAAVDQPDAARKSSPTAQRPSLEPCTCHRPLLLQTWPLAYWPDGSLKFSAFATVAGAAGPYLIAHGAARASAALSVRHGGGNIDIDPGTAEVRVGTRGTDLIRSMVVDGREVAKNGRLAGLLHQGPDPDEGAMPARAAFASSIGKVTIEQSGPVRAVIKVEGGHRLGKGGRAWLPFSLRLYFYAGDPAIRVVHTLIYDGNQGKDFIRGLGLRFTVPLREAVYNRHVAFAGE